MKIRNEKLFKRGRRHRRIRKKIQGTPERPRLCVFKSARHIYAQIVDDTTGTTLVSASSIKLGTKVDGGKKSKAKEVGKLLAESAKQKGISKVAFDRGGYLYHGRVAALADGARENGLEF
jgi:large subunit ribosomal protein L18